MGACVRGRHGLPATESGEELAAGRPASDRIDDEGGGLLSLGTEGEGEGKAIGRTELAGSGSLQEDDDDKGVARGARTVPSSHASLFLLHCRMGREDAEMGRTWRLLRYRPSLQPGMHIPFGRAWRVQVL
jgi:hypothetical protein